MTDKSIPSVAKGGPGNKAPYDITHIRVPVPIKPKVEQYINEFRRAVSEGDVIVNGTDIYYQEDLSIALDWGDAFKAVNQFIEEKCLENSMHTRNNVNLARLRDWLEVKAREAGY